MRCEPPVGLSGHTATLINSKLICVIGREGGIKIQRRFGQMFFLHLDIPHKKYWYSEAPVTIQSRSGHTTIFQNGDKSDNIDLLGMISHKTVNNITFPEAVDRCNRNC